MVTSWQQRSEQWRRFAEWERRQLREDPPSFEQALAWMNEAYELAGRTVPGWASDLDLAHVRHLQRVRAMLARAAFPR